MENNDLKDTKDRFFKHRRNLLLLSSIFLFLVLSGGTIGKLNLLGAEIKFSNPTIPIKLFFISIVYMLVKYIQFLLEIGGTGFTSKLHEIIFKRVPVIAKKIASNKQDNKKDIPVNNYQIIENHFYKFTVIEKIEGQNSHSTINVTLKNTWFEFIKAFFSIVVKTTWFSEYIVPLILTLIGLYIYLFFDFSHVQIIRL